ncbi:hypothetical protein FRC06_011903 [Ceratobasidium sp. 370]|nr:hypothetical protein FRC06_011903 [Ceratobasidium sp. 370]
MSVTQQFRNLWTVSSLQKSLLTSVTVSPNGLWLMSASLDKDMVFVDFRSGTVVGTVDLSSGHFHVTSGVWRTDGRLYIGTSDGQAFQLNFDPTTSRPVSMSRLLQLPNNQKASIRALAFDSARQIIAMGRGAEVHIYSQSMAFGSGEWNCIERISGPCEGNQGIVTALCFFGQLPTERCLFVGYAMAGFCLWKSPGNFERTPMGRSVSSIGSATISSDEQFIAISSLEQSIVTYPLGPGGPVLQEQREFPFRERTEYSPIVPIALTTGNLIFKGTASGDVPVLDSMNGPMTPIHLGTKRIVRTLTTHDDKVVVGSSDAAESREGSRVECYSTGLAVTHPGWSHPTYTPPYFKLTLNDILLLEQRTVAEKIQAYLGGFDKFWDTLRGVWRVLGPWLVRRAIIKTLFFVWVLAIVLTVDPPYVLNATGSARPGPKPATRGNSVAVFAAPNTTPRPTNPGLLYLLGYLLSFILARFTLWGMWFLICISALLAAAFKWLILGLCLIPQGMLFVSTEIPAFISAAICDTLQELGLGGVCGVAAAATN